MEDSGKIADRGLAGGCRSMCFESLKVFMQNYVCLNVTEIEIRKNENYADSVFMLITLVPHRQEINNGLYRTRIVGFRTHQEKVKN